MACPSQNPIPAVYRAEDIHVIHGAHVRLRPGMYIGSTDSRGLFHLLFELVAESFAEVVADRGRSVRVTLYADGSAEVADDGRPMPNVEEVFTEFNAGQRGDVDPYQLRTGVHDGSYVIANALSERLTVFTRESGSVYQHAFRRGVTHAVLQSGGPPGDRGLTVVFQPDPLIFGEARFDADTIRDRLRQLAFLHSGVNITFTDETAGTREEFEYADGIRECVRWLNADRRPLHADVIALRGEEAGVRYEVGLQWCEECEEVRMSFANHYHTPQGGMHDNGLRSGVVAGLRDYIQTVAPEAGKFEGEALRVGLAAIVSVWLREPVFTGAARSQLGNPEVEAITKAVIRRGLCEYLEANRASAERVVKAVVASRGEKQ